MAIARREILRRLRKNIEEGRPIIGTGAGTGISAKFEEAGQTLLLCTIPAATAWLGAALVPGFWHMVMQMPS